jgi:antitoxin (DNA-binding transcriptional repressor) of toxin-antitoxin stability system
LPNQIQSDKVKSVKILSVTEVARHFREVIDSVENKQEEIVLVRNRKQVARLVPEPPAQDALEVFGDLFRTLDDETADALSTAIAAAKKSRRGRISELRNPWVG